MQFDKLLILLLTLVTTHCVFCHDIYSEGATERSKEFEGDSDRAFIVIDENANERMYIRNNVKDPDDDNPNEDDDDEEDDEDERVTIFNDNSDGAEKKPENDEVASKATPDFSELPFDEKLKKIKMIPMTRYIFESGETRKPDMLQPIKQEISINFVIKPKITIRPIEEEIDGVSSGSGSSGSGSGSGISEEDRSNNSNDKRNTTTGISTYIIKDTDGSGSADDVSGSGKDEQNESGSGSQYQQNDKSILTYRLEALTKPNHMLNETSHSVQSIAQRERARRSVSKHHMNQKKGFVPQTGDIFVPQRNEDIQNPEQLTNLFMSTLHSNFKTEPEFGNTDDQWSNTDLRALSDMAHNGNEDEKQLHATQQLQTREMAFENKVQEMEPPQINMKQHQLNQINRYNENIEETPQNDEGRFVQENQNPFEENSMGTAAEQASDNFEALSQQSAPHQAQASNQGITPPDMVESPLMGQPETADSAKLKAAKQSKSEMESAESKYQAMENAQLATELRNRKESFNLNAGVDENAAVRSHLSKQIKRRTKKNKKRKQ